MNVTCSRNTVVATIQEMSSLTERFQNIHIHDEIANLKQVLFEKNVSVASCRLNAIITKNPHWWQEAPEQKAILFLFVVYTKDKELILQCIRQGVLLASKDAGQDNEWNDLTLWDQLITSMPDLAREVIDALPANNSAAIESMVISLVLTHDIENLQLVFRQYKNSLNLWFSSNVAHKLFDEMSIFSRPIQRVAIEYLVDYEDSLGMRHVVDVLKNHKEGGRYLFSLLTGTDADSVFAVNVCSLLVQSQDAAPLWWNGTLKTEVVATIASHRLANKKNICERLVNDTIVDVKQTTLVAQIESLGWFDSMRVLVRKGFPVTTSTFLNMQNSLDIFYECLKERYLTVQRIAAKQSETVTLLQNYPFCKKYVAELLSANQLDSIFEIIQLFESTYGCCFFRQSYAPSWWNSQVQEPSAIFVAALNANRNDIAKRLIPLTNDSVFPKVVQLYGDNKSRAAHQLIIDLKGTEKSMQPDWWKRDFIQNGLISLDIEYSNDPARVIRWYFSSSFTPAQICSALGTRKTQLLALHPHFGTDKLFSFLDKRAKRQFNVILKQASGEDVSLGSIQGLLRRNLASTELEQLQGFIGRNKGVVAKKLVQEMKTKTLPNSVEFLIHNLLTKDEITEQNVHALESVKIPQQYAQRYLQRLHERNRQTTSQDYVTALETFYTQIREAWPCFELRRPDEGVLLTITLFVANLLRLTAGKQQHKLLYSTQSHVQRGIAIFPEGCALLARKTQQVAIGKGTFKTAAAVMLLWLVNQSQVAENSQTVPQYGVVQAVRLLPKNIKAIDEIVYDANFVQTFQNKTGFLKSYGLFSTSKNQFIIYPRCLKLGERELTEYQVLFLMHDIAAAVVALHEQHKYHFDIKPENIVFEICDERVKGYLIDFNLASTQPSYYYKNLGLYGSVVFTSPELLRNRYKGDPAIVENFALGVTFYMITHKMFTSGIPFWEQGVDNFNHGRCDRSEAIAIMDRELVAYHKRQESVIKLVESGGTSVTASTMATYLTTKLLITDPAKRWTAQQVLSLLKESLGL